MKKPGWKSEKNLSLLVDFYEITMTNGYLMNKDTDVRVYFDYFFRRVPDGGGFAITAGLEQFIDYIVNIEFSQEDIEMLRKMDMFCEEFLDYLKNFKFDGDIWAIPEGTPVFPNTPIITIGASILQAQLIETMLLLTLNHQSLIATKANRIVRAAGKKPVVDFGARRGHGIDATLYGARAMYISGCIGTSNVLAHKMFDIPVIGTMAHSWVQFYGDDRTAFQNYAMAYPHKSVFLVDTYNVLNSGVPAAIDVFRTMEENASKGIRLDSGDLNYFAVKSRELLDEAGFTDAKITVSSSLDEYKIRELEMQGAPIDSYGVGERMMTSSSEPVYGGVYKLVAVEKDGIIEPRIKLSEDIIKVTNPGLKDVWRFYDNNTGKAFSDLLTFKGESVGQTYVLFDEAMPSKKKTAKNFTARKLQELIIEKGKVVYKFPTLDEIRQYCQSEINKLWDGLLRFETPDQYYVNLSFDLWNEKRSQIEENYTKLESSSN
ncbi:MAG: nicotinate phosphoribosyltransferase [Clostridiales bacterium]|nr:nicotinate phosphoribosyltransferase [Clostridiales bacterium]